MSELHFQPLNLPKICLHDIKVYKSIMYLCSTHLFFDKGPATLPPSTGKKIMVETRSAVDDWLQKRPNLTSSFIFTFNPFVSIEHLYCERGV